MERETAAEALSNLRMRLLDLTARNRLINFRHTKNSSLRIIDELPDQLVQMLLADTEMRFLPIPEPTERQLIDAGYLEFDEETQELTRLRNNPSAEEWAKHLGFSTAYEVPEASPDDVLPNHADTAIQTLFYPYEMEARLKSLLSTAESAIQEMGANILYLSFGFLEWFDSNNDKARIAPLLLVPVRLNKGRLNSVNRTYEYTLSYSGEGIIPNLSLREKLRADFAMALPDLDENTIPETYFSELQALLDENQPRWRVRRFISLTLLNFSKLLMYLDLDPSRWPDNSNIIDHPIITRFLAGFDGEVNGEEAGQNFGFGEEYLIDEMEDIHNTYPLIDDADSSQHSALIDAVNGENLVIEGPPGTGKSQTITNLIAAAMAQGKRVLFVAEKLAALEVVRSRLDAVNLGEFCLELHSHKSQKRKVLDEVGDRLKKHGQYRRPVDIDVDIARYEELKTQLKKHAERVNSPWKNTGKTPHEIFMASTRYRASIGLNPDALHPKGYDGNNYDLITQRRNEDQVQAFRSVYRAIASQLGDNIELQNHPWYGVSNSSLQIFDLERVIQPLNEWQIALHKIHLERVEIAKVLHSGLDDVSENLQGIKIFQEELERLPVLKGDELLDCLSVLQGDLLEKVQRFYKLFLGIQSMYASIAEKTGAEVLNDLSVVDQLLDGSSQLKQLIGSSIKLSDLAEAINRLTAIQDQLGQLDDPLSAISHAIGETGIDHLLISKKGLTEYKVIIDIVSDLSPSLWKFRDEVFDNDELDEILPELDKELKDLLNLYENLELAYSFDDLPRKVELQQLESVLLAGGAFRWFKSNWRTARSQLLSYAATPKIKYSSMLPLLSEFAEFSDKNTKFENNAKYRESLGVQMQGLKTDTASIKSLRKWYKKVRRHYGVGFGKKVVLGDAILDLSPSTARAIRSLSDRGIQQQLSDLQDDIDSLKGVFSPVTELQNDSTHLTGETGIVPQLLRSVDMAIRACGPLVSDDSLSMADLAERIEKIDSLKKAVDKWVNADIDRRLFKGRLELVLGVDADNKAGLSKWHNTMIISECLDKQVTNQQLLQFIHQNPVNSTFESLRELSKNLNVALTAQDTSFKVFKDVVMLDTRDWMNQSSDHIEDLITRNKSALDNGDMLQNWLDYVRVRDQVEALGLINLVDNIEQGELGIDLAEEGYLAGIYDLLSREILQEDAELGRFSGHSQEAVQSKFKEYDNRLKNLQCEQIAWKADQTNIPVGNSGGKVSSYTERGLLEHECGLQRPRTPIRQVINRAGNALVALKPCFMMGPMSVAQYLEPGQFNFDLVVMDEASQIKPQDALGAVARGAQLVVVGDPKQLPPTSFFDRIVEDEDDDTTAIEESESILDATLPLFKARRLRWHYRSQHESLISFSNHSFYGSDLVLFPSPYNSSDNYGVHFSRVKRGCFVNRRNMEEAKIISESVREHFKHRPEETIGVVAMSAEQRLQIERAIETLAKDDESFQILLDNDSLRREALFVKNLENVQGDERDVIYISMTYGPQEPGGNVFQRFGPINSDVGWRRLNVLFTRSKKRMHIFSSMGSDDIVIDATKKRGVRALRDFLAYCETGILHKTEIITGRPPDSDFEVAVMDALLKEGFECIPQVGVAGFFIDVAVVDPGNPGRYLMGIECDGATYHSAKSARDRDRLRQSILERLGWKIKRIWSTDWFKNPTAELVPIIRELNRLKTERVVEVAGASVQEEKVIIEDIVENADIQEEQMNIFLDVEQDLAETLKKFDREVILTEHPDTPANKRLLRPAMLEALLEFTPTSKSEFLELIPAYLRQSTAKEEGAYLGQVFEIINTSLEVVET